MPKRILDAEEALFDDPTLLAAEDDVEDDDPEVSMASNPRNRLEDGCVTLGLGAMRRLRPAGYGPDSDEFAFTYD